jgi:hypothetical protein
MKLENDVWNCGKERKMRKMARARTSTEDAGRGDRDKEQDQE